MTGWILAMILVPLGVAEITELSPWLAQRCVILAARFLPTVRVRERFEEEWSADLARIPGKLTKLCFAIGLLLVAAPRLRALNRRAEREVPGMLAARDQAIAALDAVVDVGALAELVAQSVSSTFKFRGVVVNFEIPDGNFESVAIHGPVALCEAMLGSTSTRLALEQLILNGRPFRSLRFIDETVDDSAVGSYVPPRRLDQEPELDTWEPEDGLLAPLYADNGRLLGVISLDEPETGRFPGPEQLAMIEAYAASAASKLSALRESGT